MLRKEKTIQLGDTSITVREITLPGIRALLPIAGDLLSAASKEKIEEICDALYNHYDTCLQVLKTSTSLGEKIEDVGYSGIKAVIRAFIEVSSDFFNDVKILTQDTVMTDMTESK